MENYSIAFKGDPDQLLNKLSDLAGYTLTNEQHQRAKLIVFRDHPGSRVTLGDLYISWLKEPVLSGFAEVFKVRILEAPP